MTITRKYFEDILNLIKDICEKGTVSILVYFELLDKLNNLLKEIKQYNLFKLELDDSFYDILENRSESEITLNRIEILAKLSLSLMETSFETDYYSDNEPNYFINLNKSLILLPYKEFIEIYRQIKLNSEDSFIIKKHIGQFPIYKNLSNETESLLYKELITADKTIISKTSKLAKIPKELVDKVTDFFKSKIDEYKNYIFQNYPSIKSEFKYFDNITRIYFKNFKDNGAHMRIYHYKNPIDEHQLYVYPYSLDFTPYEFENIELTEQNIVGGLSTYVRLDEDFEIRGNLFFSEHQIHSELVNIYISNAEELERENFLKFLLKCRGYYLNYFNKKEDDRCDFTAKFNEEIIKFIFVKGELKNIENIKRKLEEFEENEKVTFVSTYRVYSDFHKALEKENINFISINSLSTEYLNNNNSIILHWYIQNELKHFKINKSDSKVKSETLINKLRNCKSGLKGWAEYESICEEILKFLLEDYFRKYTSKSQSYSENGIFRRDLIINNNYKDINSFWGDIKNDFNSNIILIDFKNYEDELEQNELLIPTKYMNNTIGNVVIVISRKGVNKNSVTLQKKILRDGKLIISLSDEDLVEMLREKGMNNDVLYMLDNKKFLLYENE
jgi:hypothetical protein